MPARLRAAHVADDPLIASAALSFMAVQSYSAGNPRDAPRLARATRDRLGRQSVPVVESMLFIREARGHGKDPAGLKACETALSNAETSLAKGATGHDPGWLYWMSEGELHGQAGSCYLDLGHAKAVAHFQAAVDAYDTFCIRDRALCLTRKATALARLGHADEGYSEAIKAMELAGQIDSARLGDHVRTFHAVLCDHGPARLAADFREQAAPLLRPQAASR